MRGWRWEGAGEGASKRRDGVGCLEDPAGTSMIKRQEGPLCQIGQVLHVQSDRDRKEGGGGGGVGGRLVW